MPKTRKTRQKAKSQALPVERKNIGLPLRNDVLTEAGYRCAVPTCRGILAMDLHHLYQVKEGGKNEVANLIALCPTCHALYHRGTISRESIYVYKSMLVALGKAFDFAAIDLLLFLSTVKPNDLLISGDGLLRFASLIAAGLATWRLEANNNNQIVTYSINLTEKGQMLIENWKAGNRKALGRVA